MTVYTGIPYTPSDHLPGYEYGNRGVDPAETHVVSRYDLWSTKSGSDKVYVIIVSCNSANPKTASIFVTECFYGRRGRNASRTIKYTGPSQTIAMATAAKFLSEKLGEGYQRYALAGTPSTASYATDNMQRVVPPMMANPTSKKNLSTLLDKPEYIVEEWYPEGISCIISFGYNRHLIHAWRRGASNPVELNLDPTASLDLAPFYDYAWTNGTQLHAVLISHDPKYKGRKDLLWQDLQMDKAIGLQFIVVDIIARRSERLANIRWSERRKTLTEIFQDIHNDQPFKPNVYDDPHAPMILQRYAFMKTKKDFFDQLLADPTKSVVLKGVQTAYYYMTEGHKDWWTYADRQDKN